MIIEVLTGKHGTVRQRVRVDGASLSIGRALTNAVILEDPHVDAVHARVLRTDDGHYALEDAGSVNRIEALSGLLHDRVSLADGTEVQLGKTWLRFRDEDAPVAPAVALQRSVATPARAPRWHERTTGRVGLVVSALLLTGAEGWLDTAELDAGTQVLGATLAVAVAFIVWAGIWAVAARAVTGKFAFLAHLAVIAAAWIVFDVGDHLKNIVEFFLPENRVVPVLYTGLLLAVLAALVAGHLAFSSHLNGAARWRVGATVSAVLLALLGAFALVDDDRFTSAAAYSSEIRTFSPSLVPKQSVEEFSAEMADLRADVDELLAKKE